jgi:hypothetical protein
MARAYRNFVPGYIWHITHRCHKREFLLKFAKDRYRWMELLSVSKCFWISSIEGCDGIISPLLKYFGCGETDMFRIDGFVMLHGRGNQRTSCKVVCPSEDTTRTLMDGGDGVGVAH